MTTAHERELARQRQRRRTIKKRQSGTTELRLWVPRDLAPTIRQTVADMIAARRGDTPDPSGTDTPG